MTHEYTLLVGGTILRGHDSSPVTAVAWATGTVIALGTDAEIRAISRGDSTVLDLRGAFVVGLASTETDARTSAILEIGDPADVAIFNADPRLSGSGPLKPAAIIRGGHVVEGRLPTAEDVGSQRNRHRRCSRR